MAFQNPTRIAADPVANLSAPSLPRRGQTTLVGREVQLHIDRRPAEGAAVMRSSEAVMSYGFFARARHSA